MTQKMYACETDIPKDGIWEKYTDIGNTTCSFCAKMCQAPDIDNSVGFFDGFAGRAVLITYIVIVVFTLLYQVYVQFFRNKQIDKEWDELTATNRDSLRGEG